MSTVPRARASHTRTKTDLFGRFRVFWRPDGRPEDRYGRDAEECRRGAEAAVEVAAEVVALVERLEERLVLGRECGGQFWRRWVANVAVIERIRDRDIYFSEELRRLEERERDAADGADAACAREVQP